MLSAPRLNLGHGRDSVGELPSGQPEDRSPDGMAAEERRRMQAALIRELRELIDRTEDVGQRFAEEARRMHFREAPFRPIRGSASPEETRALREEGVEVLTLPLPDMLKTRLQ